MSIRLQNEVMALKLRCDDQDARIDELENRLELATEGLEQVQALLTAQARQAPKGKAA